MPQLTPFYFLNQVLITFIVMTFIIFFSSKFSLPLLIRIFNTRNLLKK